MAYSKSQYDEHFGQFIKSLEDRLTEYGLKVTPFKRFWKWLKEINERIPGIKIS